jgi:PKD repeat protein
LQWQSKTTIGSWTDIPNATSLTYPPPVLSETTLYRLRQIDKFCNPDDEVHTNEVTLTVIPTPVPTLSGPSLVCVYSSGNFYQTQPGKQNYEWTVSGGVVSAGGGVSDYFVTVTWNTLGVGTVTVSYHEPVHDCPAAAPVSYQVSVVNPPVPTIATSPPGATVGCVDQCVTFETEAGMTNYQWSVSPGGQICSLGQPTDRRVVVKWTAAGSHWVSVNYLGLAGCIANLATVYPITIIPAPTPTITGPNVLCESGQINTYSTESGMNGYQWTVSSGGTIAGGFGSNQINVIWNTIGNHSVSVSYTNIFGCEAVTPTVYPVSVTPNPVPLLTGNTSACVGSNSNVYVTDPGNSNYLWTISAGGQILSGGGPNDYTVTVQWNTPGFQSVSVGYTNPNGCEPIIPTNLAVLVQPHPVPVIVGPSTVCKSTNSVSYATQAGMSNYSWVVSSGGQIINGTGTNTIYVQWFGIGNQTVAVNFTNTNGCSAVNPASFAVSVSEWPTSNFSADTVCLGTPTTFNNLSSAGTGQIQTYYWEFGDGQISNLATPLHTYASTGTYPVKLTVTNSAGCYKDTTKMVLVWPKPHALFSTSAQNCAGDSVQFTDLSTTGHGYITQWVWDYGDGSPIVTVPFPQNPNKKHKYQNGGNYFAKLTITTSDGCTSEKINTVSVAIRPLANFTFATSSCADLPLQFTDLSQLNGGPPISGWSWNFGDPGSGTANFSSVQNPQHIFAYGGNYQVWLQVTNANGCSDSLTKPVIIHDRPTAKFSVDSSCIHAPTQFSDESTTPSGSVVAWLWNFGDPTSGTSNTSTLQNPVHIFNTPGSYMVNLQATNNFQCVHDTTILVTTNPKPIADFSSSVSCKGDVTYFTDLSIAPNSSIKAWNWDFGDGTTASIQDPQHIYQTAGTFNVKLVVTNLFNCRDSIVKPVLVRYKPEANYNYQAYFCPVGQVAFQDSSQAYGGASILTRTWLFENGSSSNAINPVHIFPQTNQKYEVVLMVEDNFGCRDTIADSVMVKPGFDLTFNYDTACFGSPTYFRAINLAAGDSLFTIHWDFGDPASGPNNYSNDSTPVHMFTGTGTYVVRLRAFNSDNCVDSLFRFVSVRKLPEPSFNALTRICNDTVRFVDKSKPGYGEITRWTWHWGDGSSPLVIVPPETGDTIHKFPSPGTYQVKLVVTNEHGCIDSITQEVQIQCITAGFAQYNPFNCSSDSIGFADLSSPVANIASWHWNFGDGSILDYSSFRDTIRHKFLPGTYQVSLTIATGSGPGSVQSVSQAVVTIHPAPVAAFSNSVVCLGDSTRYIDLAQDNNVPIVTRSWFFGDGNSITYVDTTINPVHLFNKAGSFNTKYRVINAIGCRDSAVIPVKVRRLPVAAFSGSPPCQRYELTYQDASIPGDTSMALWYWYFNNPAYPFDTLRTPVVKQRFDSTGKYDVYFKVADHFGCTDDTVYQNFEVKPSPVAAFTITEEVDGRPGKIRLNNLCVGALDKAWKWDYETGKSTERNPVVTYTDDQRTYTIELVVWNDFDCYDTVRTSYKFEYDNLYVPNAFSPDSYIIDIRQFKPKGRNLKDYKIMVFDKAGHLLWEDTEIDPDGRPVKGWDGTFKGEPMPQDVYVWKIQATFNNNKVWEGSDSGTGTRSTMGTVTLIR